MRQPVQPPLGLAGARRGIAQAMRELGWVKGEEAGVLDGEVRRREEGLGVVRGFERRKRGLEGGMERAMGEEEEGGGIEGLKRERERVEGEVRGLEERVRGLVARRGGLQREIERRESERESRVSSWREGVRGVEEGVERFLRGLGEGGGVGGRSLERCRGEWEGEREALVRRREGVERERVALEEGGRVWEEVVGVVGGVEAGLRDVVGRGGGEEGMRGMEERMDRAVEVLEGKVGIARARGWTLLVCAVGAEMEALREGRDVLRAALGAARGSRVDGEGDATEGYGDGGAGSANGRAAGEEEFGSLSLGGVPVREHRVRPSSLLDRSEDEDDGPGPEFLTSHQGEDE